MTASDPKAASGAETVPAAAGRRLALIGGAAAAAVLAAGAALYGTHLGGNRACAAAAEAGRRAAPFARGEVAAFALAKDPGPAPEVRFTGPNGEPVSFSDLKGRTVLVNLWATWCAPCKAEMPALDRLQTKAGSADFAVVAVNLDTRNLDRARTWMKENGIGSLAYYSDPGGRMLPALQKSGEVVGLPTTIVLDKAGCEVGVMKGPADWASEDALALIRALVG